MEERTRTDIGVGFALLVALLLVYSPSLTTPFAFADDYVNFSRGPEAQYVLNASIASGRFLQAFIVEHSFGWADTLADLRYLRLAGVLGVALIAFMLYRAAMRAGFSVLPSAALALLVTTTPPFQCLASWTVMFSVFWSAVMAMVAYRLTEVAFDARGWRRVGLYAAAVALLFASGAIYQVSLMFYLVPFALRTLSAEPERDRPVQRIVAPALVMGAGLVLGLLAFKIALTTSYKQFIDPGRAGLATDYVAKLKYFYEGPLRDALQLSKLWPMSYLPLVITLFTLGGLVLYFRGTWLRRIAMVLIAIGLVPAVYLPNLVTKENWGAYRTQLALTSMLMVLAFLALHGWARLLPKRLERAPTLAVATAAALCALVASHNVTTYFALNQMTEIRIMKSQLARARLDQLKKIHVAGSPTYAPMVPVRYDEFGLPTSAHYWALAPMTKVILRDMTHDTAKVAIEMAPQNKVFRPPAGEYLVNMSRLDLFK